MINPDFSEWTEVSLKEVSRNEEIPLNGKKKIETSKELGHLLKIRVQEIKWGLKTSKPINRGTFNKPYSKGKFPQIFARNKAH